MPGKHTHDYFRHGTTNLFAASNITDSTVTYSTHRRHRAAEFKKFLTTIDTEVPTELSVHIVCDNYTTHKSPLVKNWVSAHPRFHLHLTPTGSSWDEPHRTLVCPSPNNSDNTQHTKTSTPSNKTPELGLKTGTKTRNPSPGPQPPSKSTNPSPD
ncbi:MAG: hypothetical protein B5766_11310 [Candidatus Lumbricidophila eiseniae]|uniref:Tc1-like transposase DDE domain-containing protein n=1 Tax=Candidatus Lumbricidiphila eiseniae TaxID=1969409 RepID=A0A2A6FPI7_9MICO|nr:MAG: hypothetical protein B5766_11310 [Candidatus Lumbricidophila eiseniae]